MGKAKRTRANRSTSEFKHTLARRTFSPGELAVDHEKTLGLIASMDADDLPTFGLACFYLTWSPVRSANQCLMASALLMLSMRSYGVAANVVAVTLDVPWAEGGRGVRYGRPVPDMSDEGVIGHVGILTDESFIDATAWQFPEIREEIGHARPIVAKIGEEQSSLVADRGGVLQTRLSSGAQVTYRVSPVGSADDVFLRYVDMQPDRLELARGLHSLSESYSSAVSLLRPGVRTRFPAFNASVEQSPDMYEV